MPKILLGIFLILLGYKLMAELAIINKPVTPKVTCCSPDSEKAEKEKLDECESDPDNLFYTNYHFNWPDHLKTTTSGTFSLHFKVRTGYLNPAYIPPNFS